jgi:AcrR family transcriptional regulator
MRVFAQRGYEGSSMTEIAREGGVTAAVIYDHFPSKQQLHGALLVRQTDALVDHVAQAVAQAAPEREQRMTVGVDAFFEFVEVNPFAWRLIFRDPPADPAIAAVHLRIHKRATQGIALLLAASAPDFLLGNPRREQTLEMFAELLKMSLNGMAAWWYEHPSITRAEVVQRTLDFCWRGLERLPNQDGSSEQGTTTAKET